MFKQPLATNSNYKPNRMKLASTTLFALSLLLFTSCNEQDHFFDASGSFEATETIISAEANGVLKSFVIEEGQSIKKGQLIGYIDSTQLYLKKKQLLAQIAALNSRKPNVSLQISALQEQLKNALFEKDRIEKLVENDAATQKQLDDLKSNIKVITKQMEAQQSSLNISNDGLSKDVNQFKVQIEQLEDQISKSLIVNPINGTVLAKYAQQDEMALSSKALYKIADLSSLILRAYISGDQLSKIKLNQTVSVFTDDGEGGFKETQGVVTWISSKAEFTPKTIQTKNERANMVYAVKIQVANDGSYKMGMYGEIQFSE